MQIYKKILSLWTFPFLLSHYFIKIGFQFGIGTEIPKRQATNLIKIIPIIIELGNVLLTRRIFGTLSVVQVQRINLANQKGFNTGLVTLLRYEIRYTLTARI